MRPRSHVSTCMRPFNMKRFHLIQRLTVHPAASQAAANFFVIEPPALKSASCTSPKLQPVQRIVTVYHDHPTCMLICMHCVGGSKISPLLREFLNSVLFALKLHLLTGRPASVRLCTFRGKCSFTPD